MARPSKLTPATEKVILDALRAGATRTAAFEAAGISRRRIAGYLRDFVAFRLAVITAEAGAEVYMTIKVRQAADAGSWRAALAWLEKRRPADWGKRITIDLDGEIRALVRAAGLGDDIAAEAIAEAEEILRRAGG